MHGTALCVHLSDWERGGHQSLTQAKGPTQGQKKARMQVLTHDKLAKTNIIFTSRTNANIMFGSRTNALIVASYWLPKGNLTCTSDMHCRRFGWPIMYVFDLRILSAKSSQKRKL